MRAFIDTEIEVTSNDETGTHVAEVTKQRDLDGRGTRFGFRLRQVVIGRNRWGNDRASCVVDATDAPPKPATDSGKRPSEIAGALIEALTHFPGGMTRGALVKHFGTRYRPASVYKEIKKQIEGKRLREVGGGVVGLASTQ